MNEFIARYQNEIAGALSGFARVLFRGALRSLYALPVMNRYAGSKVQNNISPRRKVAKKTKHKEDWRTPIEKIKTGFFAVSLRLRVFA